MKGLVVDMSMRKHGFYTDKGKERILRRRMARYQKMLHLGEHQHPYLLPVLRRYIISEIEIEACELKISEKGGYMECDPRLIDTLTKLKKMQNDTMEMIHRVRDHDKIRTHYSLTHMLRKSIKPGEEILIKQAEEEGVGKFEEGWRQKNLYKTPNDKPEQRSHGRQKP